MKQFDKSARRLSGRSRRAAVWGAMGLLLALLLIIPTRGAPAQQAGGYTVALPLVVAGSSLPPPPPPSPSQGGVFPQQDIRTTSPAIAADAAGTTHIAYVVYGSSSEQPPVYYAACPATSDCLNPASWQRVVLDQNIDEVQIALTPAWQPRLLYRTALVNGSTHDYYYAACDSGCTSAAQWATVRVAGTTKVDAEEWDLAQHSFALDRQGRPRFVYVTGGLGDPKKGAFYTYCDANCTTNDPGDPSWFETQIALNNGYETEIFDLPVLTFTAQNQPRVLVLIYGERDGIHYLACDSACEDSQNWERAFLLDRGYGMMASWDLELDASDRPRVAIYQEGLDGGGGDVLIYGWCDATCADENSWQGTLIGLAQNDGETPDLELDGQGRPRIAYHAAAGVGLGYAWCNGACETEAGWRTTNLEPSEAIDASYPVPVPPICEKAAWVAGFQPKLTLDAHGNPRVGAEAQRLMSCLYQDPADPTRPPYSRIETYRHVRFFFAPQP
jgi:hypothetical protein